MEINGENVFHLINHYSGLVVTCLIALAIIAYDAKRRKNMSDKERRELDREDDDLYDW